MYNVFSTDLLPVFKNQKDKGVINGMATNELGMGFTLIHGFRETS